MVSKYIKVGVI